MASLDAPHYSCASEPWRRPALWLPLLAATLLALSLGLELRSYLARFEEIWREEGSSISATTLGL